MWPRTSFRRLKWIYSSVKLLFNWQKVTKLRDMDTRQGFWVIAVVILTACNQQVPIQQDAKVQRGEAVQRATPEPKPFIEEVVQPQPVIEAPVPDKPQSTTVADNNIEGKPAIAKPLDPVQKIGDYSLLGFDRLASFAYEVPDDPITEPKAKEILEKNEIPDSVKKFDKQKIALKGYMLPLKVEDGKITELLILRDQSMCCYGAVPKINEWVSVRMPKGKGVKPVMDVPVTIFGTLKVGEVLENGYLVGIYEMDGERLDGPIDL
jgi:hypothetical protein